MWYSTLFYFLFGLFFWFAINNLTKELEEEKNATNGLISSVVLVFMICGLIGSVIALIKNLFQLIFL